MGMEKKPFDARPCCQLICIPLVMDDRTTRYNIIYLLLLLLEAVREGIFEKYNAR